MNSTASKVILPSGRRIFRWTGFSLLALVLVVWLAGTATALLAVTLPAGACKAPFRAWAITWPVWKIVPDALPSFVEWSFTLCPSSGAAAH